MIADVSKSAGQQELQAFGSYGRWEGWGVFTPAGCLNAGNQNSKNLADGCHGTLARRLDAACFEDGRTRLLAL